MILHVLPENGSSAVLLVTLRTAVEPNLRRLHPLLIMALHVSVQLQLRKQINDHNSHLLCITTTLASLLRPFYMTVRTCWLKMSCPHRFLLTYTSSENANDLLALELFDVCYIGTIQAQSDNSRHCCNYYTGFDYSVNLCALRFQILGQNCYCSKFISCILLLC